MCYEQVECISCTNKICKQVTKLCKNIVIFFKLKFFFKCKIEVHVDINGWKIYYQGKYFFFTSSLVVGNKSTPCCLRCVRKKTLSKM